MRWLGIVGCTLVVACGTQVVQDTEVPEDPLDCRADACDGRCTDVGFDPFNCGECGITCVVPNAEPACTFGTCGLGACDPGWADCDGDPANGCELDTTCAAGSPCGTTCGSVGTLDCTDVCEPTCMPPEEVCNLADDDCDGACDEDVDGCRRRVYRATGSLGHLYGLDASEAVLYEQTVEASRYFWLLTTPAPGASPLYRCDKGGGRRFLTRSSRCEGLDQPPELLMGYVADGPTCGAVPLYRLFSGAQSDHLYTLSEDERDQAARQGYRPEGIVGWVFTTR